MSRAELEAAVDDVLNVSTDLVAAIAAAQADMKPVVKNATNPHFKSKYADLAAVLDVVRPALARQGVAVLQPIAVTEFGPVLRTELRKGDAVLVSEMPLSLDGLNAQQIGSLLTYMRRYGLTSMVGVAAEEDDDGNAVQHVSQAPQAPRDRARTIPTSAPSAKQQDTFESLANRYVPTRRVEFVRHVLGEVPDPMSGAQCSKLIEALYALKNGRGVDGWIDAPAGGRADDGSEPWPQ